MKLQLQLHPEAPCFSKTTFSPSLKAFKTKKNRRPMNRSQLDDALVWVAWCAYFQTHALREVCEHADEGIKALTSAIAKCDPNQITDDLKDSLSTIFSGWSQFEKLRNKELAPLVKEQLKATNRLKKIISFDKRMKPVYAQLFSDKEAA